MSVGHKERLSSADVISTKLPEEDSELKTSTQDVNPSRVFRKLDARLVPLVTLLFLLSFL